MVHNCNGINHGYTLLYKPKTPIVTMGSEKDCCLSKSGPHHIELLTLASRNIKVVLNKQWLNSQILLFVGRKMWKFNLE